MLCIKRDNVKLIIRRFCLNALHLGVQTIYFGNNIFVCLQSSFAAPESDTLLLSLVSDSYITVTLFIMERNTRTILF